MDLRSVKRKRKTKYNLFTIHYHIEVTIFVPLITNYVVVKLPYWYHYYGTYISFNYEQILTTRFSQLLN